jgi:ribose transport system ATP-binding protein
MLLKADALTKTYGSTQALKGVGLELRSGEILGLVGENGSGKSTLLRLLSGMQRPDSGTITVDGQPLRTGSLAVGARQGIGLVFQELALIAGLPVFENFFLRAPKLSFRLGFLRTAALKDLCREICRRYGVECEPGEPVGNLPFHQRQLLEIAREIEVPKLLGAPRSILLLDEPTTALSQPETERLIAILGDIRAAGASMIFVSHRLSEALSISDRILVLRDGQPVAERERGRTTERELQALMVGRERAADYFHTRERAGIRTKVVLDLHELTGSGFCAVTLSVQEGEIVGLAGLESSGKSELCEAIHGLRRVEAGRMTLCGRAVYRATPFGQVKNGAAYVPKERLTGGIIESDTIARNVGLHMLRARPWVDPPRERRAAAEVIRRFGVKARSATSLLRSLSGGNQQKVVLGKWLISSPRLLVLDNPTRGVDVGARTEIYKAIRAATAQGAGVLLASDELSEMLGLCDRIYIMKDRNVTQEVIPTHLKGGHGDWERELVRHMV